jgi:prevent-host-death family protein
MKLSQDLKPVSYFKNNMAEVIRKLNENQGTMVITQNGEAKVVMMDIKVYEDLQESLSMLELIAQGKKNIKEGKIRPADQVLSELGSRIQEDFS